MRRAAGCDVRVVDWFVEPVQAQIVQDGPVFVLHAIGEPGRVLLNGTAVVAEARLCSGDVIEMGVTRLIFAQGAAEAEAARLRPLPDCMPVAVTAADAEMAVRPNEAVEEEPGVAFEVQSEEAPSEAVAEGRRDDLPSQVAAEPERVSAEASQEPDELLADDLPPFADLGARAAEEPEGIAPEEPSPNQEAVAARELSEKDRKALAMWERALQNPSAAVRRHATEQIRRLTGRNDV